MSKKRDAGVSLGLRYKLRLAFYLLLVLPLLLTMYVAVNYIFLKIGYAPGVFFFMGISVVITAAGFLLIKDVFDRVRFVSSQARRIVSGRPAASSRSASDEIGDLDEALQAFTAKIRTDMQELKNYGEKTSEINAQIQKRVLALSSLVQISSFLTQGSSLEEVLGIAVDKLKLLTQAPTAFLLLKAEGKEAFVVRVACGENADALRGLTVDSKDLFWREFLAEPKTYIVDKAHPLSEDAARALQERFKFSSTVVTGVYVRDELAGMVGIAQESAAAAYPLDAAELTEVLSKQVAICLENDLLLQRIAKLEIKDSLTGLFNEKYIRSRLQEEIKRSEAYQRPCGFVLIDIDNFSSFQGSFGAMDAEAALKRVAALLKDAVSEVDRVGRIGYNEFALVLPERNKRQAQIIAEEIRSRVGFSFSEYADLRRRLTLSAGVSENPLDGITADDLIEKARGALGRAHEGGMNRVAV